MRTNDWGCTGIPTGAVLEFPSSHGPNSATFEQCGHIFTDIVVCVRCIKILFDVVRN